MKYSTVFVFAVIIASGLLTAAMPAPASTTTPPSDMGDYKNHKSTDNSTMSIPLSTSVSTPMEKHQRRSPLVVSSPPVERVACGKIFVQSTGLNTGYVQGRRDSNGRYFVASDQTNALRVEFQDKAIVIDRQYQNGFPRFGATFGQAVDPAVGEDNMAGNSFNYAYISATGDMHKAGDPAITDASSFNTATSSRQHVESAIFTLGENGEILASWTNKNRQSVPVQFAMNTDRELIISANSGAYSAKFGGERAPSARLFCRANDSP